jgi:hypothetical protein
MHPPAGALSVLPARRNPCPPVPAALPVRRRWRVAAGQGERRVRTESLAVRRLLSVPARCGSGAGELVVPVAGPVADPGPSCPRCPAKALCGRAPCRRVSPRSTARTRSTSAGRASRTAARTSARGSGVGDLVPARAPECGPRMPSSSITCSGRAGRGPCCGRCGAASERPRCCRPAAAEASRAVGAGDRSDAGVGLRRSGTGEPAAVAADLGEHPGASRASTASRRWRQRWAVSIPIPNPAASRRRVSPHRRWAGTNKSCRPAAGRRHWSCRHVRHSALGIHLLRPGHRPWLSAKGRSMTQHSCGSAHSPLPGE